MLPGNSCTGGHLGTLHKPHFVRVVPACHAYFPHHRLHMTSSGMMLPRQRTGRRRPLMAPPQEEKSTAAELANWLLSGQMTQQLATSAPELLQDARSNIQTLSLVLAGAYKQAQCIWQYVSANWPAWQASLQEDAEVVFEYALGLTLAGLAAIYGTSLVWYRAAAASESVQQLTSMTAAVVAAAEASAVGAITSARLGLQQAVQAVTQQVDAGLSPPSSPRSKQSDVDKHKVLTRGNTADAAARVAYSLAWFGFGQTSPAQHHHQQLQQMSLYDWQQLQEEDQQETAPMEPVVQPRRWKTPDRRGWVNKVAARALKGNSSSQQHEHLWRQHQSAGGGIWGAPSRCAAEVLSAAQEGVQGCVEAVRASSHAAAAGIQRASCVLVEPAQQAIRHMSPPPTGVVVAAAVLLAGGIASTMSRKRREQALMAQQQQVLMTQRAEELKAQKARIMGVLSVEVPAGSSSKRKGAVGPARASIPVTVAGLDTGTGDIEEAELPAEAGSRVDLQMDQEAAAMWKKFLAGSRAMDVPMWDNRMVEDLPKVSRKEVDKQTQKIRSAAAPEERAALEQADMEQLTRQLKQLDHAPLGRQARAAWLKEQQQLRQQQQPKRRSPDQQRSSTQTPAADSSNDRAAKAEDDNSNPFVVSPEVRARWDSELDDDPIRPLPRKPIKRAGSSSSSSRSGSRNGSRSCSRSGSAADGGNPFAVSKEVRAQWEAEDHLFSEAPKPLLGNILGGLVTALTSGKSQPSAAQQHQQRRKQQLQAEEAEAAILLRLQQKEQQQQQQAVAQVHSVRPQGKGGQETGTTSQQSEHQLRSHPHGLTPGAVKQAGAPTTATGAAQGVAGPAEGSPEWNEQLRQEMLKSGAARRARMRQMQQQSTATRQQPASASAAQQQQQASPPGTSQAAGGLAAAVSMADAQDVTAAVPSMTPHIGRQRQGAPTSGPSPTAAAGSATTQPANPFAVSREAVREDERRTREADHLTADGDTSGVKLLE